MTVNMMIFCEHIHRQIVSLIMLRENLHSPVFEFKESCFDDRSGKVGLPLTSDCTWLAASDRKSEDRCSFHNETNFRVLTNKLEQILKLICWTQLSSREANCMQSLRKHVITQFNRASLPPPAWPKPFVRNSELFPHWIWFPDTQIWLHCEGAEKSIFNEFVIIALLVVPRQLNGWPCLSLGPLPITIRVLTTLQSEHGEQSWRGECTNAMFAFSMFVFHYSPWMEVFQTICWIRISLVRDRTSMSGRKLRRRRVNSCGFERENTILLVFR